MDEALERENLKRLYPTSGEICPIKHTVENTFIENGTIDEIDFNEDDDNLLDLDYDEILPDTDNVLKTFDFSKM